MKGRACRAGISTVTHLEMNGPTVYEPIGPPQEPFPTQRLQGIFQWHSTVTEVDRGPAFALRRSTLDVCLGVELLAQLVGPPELDEGPRLPVHE